MNILLPKTITAAMVASTSLAAEDPTPAWVSGSNYVVGDEVHLVSTHRVYRCAVAVTGGTVSPDQAILIWVNVRPTNKWAPFDQYTNTAATATTSLTYVFKPGYFNAIALYGLQGKTYSVTVKDATGGTVVYSRSGRLSTFGRGWWNYLFWPRVTRTKLLFTGVPLSPTAEVTVTIAGDAGSTVAIGMLVVGSYRSLLGTSMVDGGVETGATATPVTYSYIKKESDGTVNIRPGHAATDLRVDVWMPIKSADYALAKIQEVLDKPVAWVASEKEGYTGLNTFGLATRGPVVYHNVHAKCSLDIQGFV